MIGMPVATGSVPWLTALSLTGTARVCEREGIPLKFSAPVGCSAVTWARNAVVGEFLRSDCTHLFWIDADIAWRPADFIRLVGFGAMHDMIGAAYMLKREPPALVLNFPSDDQYEINPFGNIRIRSMPIGFTLCQRVVIEKVAATKEMMRDDVSNAEYPDFFRLSRSEAGKPLGEDIAFFDDAAALGFTGWLDPSIKLSHVGLKAYTGDVIAALGLDAYVKEKQE